MLTQEEVKEKDREGVKKLKEEIKKAAVEARENKRQWKEYQRTYICNGSLQPYILKARTTAMLNYYHELRGSAYRHGYKDMYEHYSYYLEYKKKLGQLREEFGSSEDPEWP